MIVYSIFYMFKGIRASNKRVKIIREKTWSEIDQVGLAIPCVDIANIPVWSTSGLSVWINILNYLLEP